MSNFGDCGMKKKRRRRKRKSEWIMGQFLINKEKSFSRSIAESEEGRERERGRGEKTKGEIPSRENE
jgi:hypothetical protein